MVESLPQTREGYSVHLPCGKGFQRQAERWTWVEVQERSPHRARMNTRWFL
jgi:hypothetical protein